MDALGGSVTVGFNTDCPDAWTDCPDNSWATGTNRVIDSVYLRLLALNPQLKGNNANDAESGTTMADLDGQAQSAVRRGAELVLIAMGTNDACGGRTGAMTEVPVFRDEFAAGHGHADRQGRPRHESTSSPSRTSTSDGRPSTPSRAS